jgi:Cdc6-like AAA superfamily ATPase
MAIDKLTIGAKTANQGVNASGKLTAVEFNQLVLKVNEMIDSLNSTVYVTQDEYDALLANDQIIDTVEYNIFEE